MSTVVIKKVYNVLLKAYGKQGWWPVTPTCATGLDSIIPIYGIKTRTERQKFEIIVGCILAQ